MKRRGRKRNTSPGEKRSTLRRPRIIGGRHRGRRLYYLGDPRTRPMKDRVREAVFDLLGPSVKGTLAIDLFAGTGALGLEALSRGAAAVTFVEQHRPTADWISRSIGELAAEGCCEVVTADAFFWVADTAVARDRRWLVFCAPPYAYYVERGDDMLQLINRVMEQAPSGSIVVVEADERFELDTLPHHDRWRTRRYPPAVIAILETNTDAGGQ